MKKKIRIRHVPRKQRSNWGYRTPAAPFVKYPYGTG